MGNRNPNFGRAGFTLLELLLVLALLAVFAGLALPLFQRTFQTLAREDASAALVKTLSYARERAVAEGTSYGVEWDPAGEAYWLTTEEADRPGVFRRLPESLAAARVLPEGLRIKCNLARIVFLPNGTASAATVNLESAQGDASVISVDPVLGLVHAQYVQKI